MYIMMFMPVYYTYYYPFQLLEILLLLYIDYH